MLKDGHVPDSDSVSGNLDLDNAVGHLGLSSTQQMFNVLLIDCVDSYTWNVYRLLQVADPNRSVAIHTVYYNQIDSSWLSENLNAFHAVVLSPGPGSPASYAENLAQVWKHNPPIPTLGICLGYQSLCLNNDATISSLEIPCHGHISNIHHIGEDIFQGIADMKGMRYHSLFAKDIKGSLTEIAWENGDHDLVMAVKHRNKPHRGVLFHPESVCSTSGEIMIKNFYDLAESHNQSRTLSPLLKEWDKLDIRPQPLIKLVRNKTITAVRTAVLEFAVGADTKRLTSQLCYGKQNYVLLESMTPGERWTIFAQFGGPQSKLLQYYTDPARVVVTNSANKSKTFKTSLCQYAASLMEDQDSYIGVENVPFWGGLIGTVGYSVGSAKFDTFTPSTCTKDPQASLLFADRSIVIDHQEHIIFVQSINQNDQTWIESKRDELSRMFSNSVPRPTRIPPNDEFRVDFPDKADYLDAIADAQAHLRAGDSYEICLTGITNVSLPRNDPKDIYSLYHHVRKNNPSPFACLVKLKGSHIIGSSPERFMRYSKNDCEFRPMKGTLKRGQYTYDQACEILQNPKDQAELRIICDLIRNDLHQIADPIDSVTVPKITSTEEFTSVYQLTSHVKGHIEPPFTGWDVLAHSLPPGSMTGAPKKRTLEIIDSLEKKRRGLYSGVTGYSSFNGNHDWSVNIRMAFQLPSYPSNQWSLGAGGAITILSDPESEWDEMITKLHSILPSMFDATAAAGQNAGQESFKILETTLLDPMATEPILMLDLHLQRARLATQAFNFVWPGSRYISQKLKDFSAKATTKSKLRWTTDRSGSLEIEATDMDELGPVVLFRIVKDSLPSNTQSAFLKFKTTKRDTYDSARRRMRIGQHEDVLLWNQDGYVTECSICNIAFSRNGVWITPRKTHGLLCGVMRSQLLERKKIKEGDILLNSICPGDKVMLFNSVREVFQGIIG